jgi:hypothetical protein
MSMTEGNKITSQLFREDIRNKDFNHAFEKVFGIKMQDFLSAYEYDVLDEFPVEMENRGIMIGFIAETIKAPAQIAYIDMDVYHHPQHMDYLAKKIPVDIAFKKTADIDAYLTPFTNCRIYHSLDNLQQMDRIILQYEDLRYELSLNEGTLISRIRVCFAEHESNINMRTYYLFDNG